MRFITHLLSKLPTDDLPLAWLQLKRQPIRYLVAVVGIGFASLLMYMQIGFQSGLLNSATTFYENLNADLFVISPGTLNSGNFKRFPQSLLTRASGISGVEETIPVYVVNINIQKLDGRKPSSLRLIGFAPNEKIFNSDSINDQLDKLKVPGDVLFDQLGNKNTGPIAQSITENGSQELITSDYSRQFKAVGLFKLGSTFAADSNLVASDTTTLQLASRQINLGEISLGLIKLKKGQPESQIQSQLQKLYGGELQVLSKQQLISQEREYWNKSTSLGVIFGFGTFMGFLVGGVVVYQVLYTDVSDHLKEYATLKAIGFANRFILTIVIQEAFLLAASSFIPATLLSAAFYSLLSAETSIRIAMTADKTLLVSSLTFGVCALSAAIAIRKLRDADPASVF
jgi:putative ABC transport system permease protein